MHRRILCFLLLILLAPAPMAATVAEAEAWLLAKDARAAPAIEALAREQPGDAAVGVLQIRLLLQQGKPEQAVDLAEEGAERWPQAAQVHYWLGNAYGQRIGQLGSMRQAMMAPKLRDAFERCLVLDPGIHEARLSLVEYYLQAPAIMGGSLDKAQAQAAELARRDPPRGHYARGRIAQHQQDLAGAASAYAAASAARPENVNYRMAAGLAYQANRQWPQAHALFAAWTRQDPKAASAWYQLGRTAALSGQHLDEGAAALRTYLGLPAAPNLPPAHHAWFRLGQIQALSGDKAAARESFGKALAGEPGNADFKAALAAL